MDLDAVLGKELLICQGANGTMLQALGLKAGLCPDLWCLEHPDLVAAVHRQYLEAGAQVLEANTFGASRIRLARHGLEDKMREINIAGVRILREVAQGRAFVAGSMGPLGVMIEPLGDFSVDRAYEEYAAQAAALAEAGPDLITLETMGDLNESRAAILACKDYAPGVKIMAEMSLGEDGRTYTGTDAETAALVLQSLGADIVGFNCSVGPERMVPAIERIARIARIPISVEPNAGMPVLGADGKTTFPMGPEEFASYGPALVKAGASVIGGCCGTTPEHIRRLRAAVDGLSPRKGPGPLGRALGLSSRSQSLFITGQDGPVEVGGRVNAARNDAISAEMLGGSMSLLRKEARDQVAAGAKVLALNAGGPGIDEPAALEKAVRVVQRAVRVPLCLLSSSARALEAGLKANVGRPLVGPFTLNEADIAAVLPLAKRYGAAVIGLTVDGEGRPSPAGRAAEIARGLVEVAVSHGIHPWDVIIEPVVAGAEGDREALEAIRGLQRELGFHTCRGVFDGLDLIVIDPAA